MRLPALGYTIILPTLSVLLSGCDSPESQPYNVSAAKKAYEATCSVCHGESGDAQHAIAKPAFEPIELHAYHWKDRYSSEEFTSYMKTKHKPPFNVTGDLLRYTEAFAPESL
tara:strand:- start:23 stop:358 length:336 start_codon:yes stop_codon:yes gene_type:complete